MLYQVELAVCYENGTWELESVQITTEDTHPTEGEIWACAISRFYATRNCEAVVAIGLYHYQEADADE